MGRRNSRKKVKEQVEREGERVKKQINWWGGVETVREEDMRISNQMLVPNASIANSRSALSSLPTDRWTPRARRQNVSWREWAWNGRKENPSRALLNGSWLLPAFTSACSFAEARRWVIPQRGGPALHQTSGWLRCMRQAFVIKRTIGPGWRYCDAMMKYRLDEYRLLILIVNQAHSIRLFLKTCLRVRDRSTIKLVLNEMWCWRVLFFIVRERG